MQSSVVQKSSQFITARPRWLAFIAGAASATGFAPLNLWPVTLVCFALFIHLVAQAGTAKRAALIGWLFGFGHFTIGNNWIAVAFTFQAAMPAWLGWIAVVALALFLAVYPAMCAWGAWWIAHLTQKHRHPREGGDPSPEMSSKPDVQEIGSRLRGSDETVKAAVTLPFILAFAGCWIITEWLRSWVFTGFAWNPLGAVWQSQLELARASAVVGTYGLSALVVAAAGLIHFALNRQWLKIATGLVALGVIWFNGIVLNFTALNGPPPSPQPLLTIVQPNISQADKYAAGYDALNFAKLAMFSRPLTYKDVKIPTSFRSPGAELDTQTRAAAADAVRAAAMHGSNGPRLVLWPEAAIPDYLEEGYPFRFYQFQPGESALGARARLTTLMGPNDILLTGSNRLVIDDAGQMAAARNSMTAMDAQGTILGHYNKAHLVPYGEYLPLKWLLTPLGLSRLVPGDVDFLPGPGPQTMTLMLDGKPVKIGLQICYEIIFSGQVVDAANRPDFLFNPSNDAWFGSWGPPQHLAQARLRAIEEGLPVVRATPTGISAVIDADGRIVESIGMGEAGRIDARLPAAKAPTLFARYGNILPVGFALLLIAFALLPLARRRLTR